MTLGELIEQLIEIRRVCHERVDVLVYCDSIEDYVPLDMVSFKPADEYSGKTAEVRII